MCVKLQEQMIFHRNASDASSVCDALTTGHEMECVDELLIDIEHYQEFYWRGGQMS